MYVFEICAEGMFVTFHWWLENVKSRSKIALFSNEHHFEIWFPKKRTISFFWSKLSKLHKKEPILHVATTFSLKQGETRTSHGPIPHPVSTKTRHAPYNVWSLKHPPAGCTLDGNLIVTDQKIPSFWEWPPPPLGITEVPGVYFFPLLLCVGNFFFSPEQDKFFFFLFPCGSSFVFFPSMCGSSFFFFTFEWVKFFFFTKTSYSPLEV